MVWRKRKHSYVNPINESLENIKGIEKISMPLNQLNISKPTKSGNSKSTKLGKKKDRKSKRYNRYLKKVNFDIEKNVSRETLTDQNEFITVDISPFDDNYENNIIEHNEKRLQNLKDQREKVLLEQKERFNKTPKDLEDIADQKRRATFEEKYGIFGQHYDVLTSVLGSKVYRMLKESMHLDSNQIMDLTYDYNGIANEKDIEHALLTLISKINDEYKGNVELLLDAMALGFTLDESEYLLSQELKNDYAPVKGIADLRDILIDELQLDEREKLKQELWEEWET